MITIRGKNVLSARVDFPRFGFWMADFDIDADDPAPFEGRQEVAWGEGVLVGTMRSPVLLNGRVRGRMFGGAYGMLTASPARFWRSASARIILSDILRAGGETLSPASTGLDRIVDAWTLHKGTVGQQIELTCDVLGINRRVLDDGTWWFGTDTWPVMSARDIVVQTENAESREVTFATERFDFRGGQVILDRNATKITYFADPSSMRVTMNYGGQNEKDALTENFAAYVRTQTVHTDFYAFYSYKVLSQNGDGTLEVVPENPDMPGMNRVPIRYEAPGVSITVAPGTKCLVGWVNGDPGKPFASHFGGGNLLGMTIDAPSVSIGGSSAVPLAKGPQMAALLSAIQEAAASAMSPATAVTAFSAISTAITTALPGIQTVKAKGL